MNALTSFTLPDATLAFALQTALGGLGLSVVTLAAAWLLRRRSEPLRYGILLAGVLGVLAVPALVGIGRTWPVPMAEPPPEIVRVRADQLPGLLQRQNHEPAAAVEPGAGSLLGSGLVALWLLGAAFGGARLVRALHRQRRALIGAPWQAAFWTDERQALLAGKLGLRRFPPVRQAPAVPLPLVIGLWRPTIVVPEAAPARWTQPQWEAVLLHEAAHIARGDPWAVLAQRGAVALFWWCPPVRVLARRLDALREQICDDCALQASGDALGYAEVLVEAAEHFLRLTALPASLGLLDSARGGLEVRVSRLLDKEKPMLTRLSLPGKLLGAACLLAAGLVTTAGTALSGGQAPPPRVQIKVLVDGKEIDLTDPNLWQHLAAAQQKARVEAEARTLRVDENSLAQAATQKAVADRQRAIAAALAALGAKAKAADGDALRFNTFSPGGTQQDYFFEVEPGKPGQPPQRKARVLVTGGKDVVIVDVQTGKILARQVRGVLARPGAAPAALKVDPRIEALVKQAEALKPGSGAAVRKALEGLPPAGTLQADKPASPQWHWKIDGGQAGTAALKVLLDQPGRPQGAGDAATVTRALEWLLKAPNKGDSPRTTPPAPPVPPAPANLDALRQQIDRLNREMNELRRRLDENNQKGK